MPRFETTQWTLVLSARGDSKESREALEQLYLNYWPPLYSYIRSRGFNIENAEDLIQGFFTALIEKNYLKSVNRERGRFRTFLLTALKNFMLNEWRRDHAQKRKGSHPHLSLNFQSAEDRYQRIASSSLTPDLLYQRQWALSLINDVMNELHKEAEERKKGEVFNRLKMFISGKPHASMRYSNLAEELGMKEGAVKTAVHRLRRKFGDRLRDKIAQTLHDPGDVDNEINSLFEIFG